MSEYFDALDVSPVPNAGPDTIAPEPYRGIYAMPAFVTIPTKDIDASVDFWTRGLGFINLFSIPGAMVHLRRWMFQDVLLVPAAKHMAQAPELSVSFAYVLDQIDSVVRACRELDPDSVDGPSDTPWNTRDVEVTTPEKVRVTCTAAKPFDPNSQQARDFEAVGISGPSHGFGDTGEHD